MRGEETKIDDGNVTTRSRAATTRTRTATTCIPQPLVQTPILPYSVKPKYNFKCLGEIYSTYKKFYCNFHWGSNTPLKMARPSRSVVGPPLPSSTNTHELRMGCAAESWPWNSVVAGATGSFAMPWVLLRRVQPSVYAPPQNPNHLSPTIPESQVLNGNPFETPFKIQFPFEIWLTCLFGSELPLEILLTFLFEHKNGFMMSIKSYRKAPRQSSPNAKSYWNSSLESNSPSQFLFRIR